MQIFDKKTPALSYKTDTANKDIKVKIGEDIHTFKKGDPNWVAWKSIPSYHDPELVYNLMVGSYVDEYKALISTDITNIIKEEADFDLFEEEAAKICHSILESGSTGRGEEVLAEFESLIHNVVLTFYSTAFHNQKLLDAIPYESIQYRFNNIITILNEELKSLSNIQDIQNIKKLILSMQILLRKFSAQSIKYGIYFREHSKDIKNEWPV